MRHVMEPANWRARAMGSLAIAFLLLSEVVVIRQHAENFTYRTEGVVIRTDQQGTLILSCRHGRQRAAWTATNNRQQITGHHIALDPHSDLALLWSPQRWAGKATPLAPENCPTNLPLRVVTHHTLQGGTAFLWSTHRRSLKGESGKPLLCQGKVVGILWGTFVQDDKRPGTLYITQSELTRFLKSRPVWQSY